MNSTHEGAATAPATSALRVRTSAAEATRSLASLTEPAANPTMVHCGSPRVASTSTVTS